MTQEPAEDVLRIHQELGIQKPTAQRFVEYAQENPAFQEQLDYCLYCNSVLPDVIFSPTGYIRRVMHDMQHGKQGWSHKHQIKILQYVESDCDYEQLTPYQKTWMEENKNEQEKNIVALCEKWGIGQGLVNEWVCAGRHLGYIERLAKIYDKLEGHEKNTGYVIKLITDEIWGIFARKPVEGSTYEKILKQEKAGEDLDQLKRTERDRYEGFLASSLEEGEPLAEDVLNKEPELASEPGDDAIDIDLQAEDWDTFELKWWKDPRMKDYPETMLDTLMLAIIDLNRNPEMRITPELADQMMEIMVGDGSQVLDIVGAFEEE